jgi:hypothetical protein
MANISEINGYGIYAQTASLANTASYIDPTFISASAAASGFGSGGSTNTGSLLTTASVSLNTITFTKGDGSTFPITVDTGSGGGGGGINDQLVALNGPNVTTTSATLVDITGFATPTLSANSGYYFEYYLATTCTGTGGIKFGFTAPSGAVGFLYIEGIGTQVTSYQFTVTTGTISGNGVTRVNGGAGVRLFGRISIGATPGVVQLQFASGTAGQTSTIGAGNGASILRLTQTA